MNQDIIDQVNYYYNKSEEQSFLQFKSENKDSNFLSQFMLYSNKCEEIIKSLEEKDIESSLNNLKNTIMEMTSKLNETTHIMKELKKNEQKETSVDTLQNFEKYYSEEEEKILKNINENLAKIKRNTYNKEFEMLSKAKKINNSKRNELKLQQLKNTLTEQLKSFQYSIKEKNSKIHTIENKKNSLNNNKMKIEKLKEEYNLNSERMTTEIANNEKCQKEIDILLNEIKELQKGQTQDNKVEEKIKEQKDMLQKLKDENALELSQLKIQQDEKNKSLESKRKGILVMVFLCYSLGYKINKINDVNNVNVSLRQKLGKLKELSTKLGIKSAQVQDETNKVDKRFIKYQMFLQRAGIDLI
jgi:DNA repair exonuclease SbcCD ATPase subunit